MNDYKPNGISAIRWMMFFLILILNISIIEIVQANDFQEYINSSGNDAPSPALKAPIHSQSMNTQRIFTSDNQEGSQDIQGIPVQWKTCSADTDCTAVVMDCVNWLPVNINYLKGFTKDLSRCTTSIDPGFQPVAVCEKHVCQITEKNSDVSWEEWLDQMKHLSHP